MKTRAQRVEAALVALGQQAPAERVAREAGLDARLARAVVTARPDDARPVLERLLDVDVQLRLAERRLRGALAWPATTLVIVLAASWVIAFSAAPALRLLPSGAKVSSVSFLLPGVVSLLLFATLAVVVSQRWSLGWLTAWASIERWSFSAAASALLRVGVPLPQAVRGAAECCSGARRRSALVLAHQLEAGGLTLDAASPLLGSLASRLFSVTAPRGEALAALDAVTSLGDASLEREVKRDAGLLAALGLGLAGLALVVTAGTFYSAYFEAAGV